MPVSYSGCHFSYWRVEKRGKQVEFGAKDRKNPIYILTQKPDSSLISDSLGVAVVRSDLRPIIIKRTDRSGPVAVAELLAWARAR